MTKLAAFLDKNIFFMLLFTVAVLPLHQELAACCVGVTFAAACIALRWGSERPREPVLRPREQRLLYLLLFLGAASLYFSRDRFLSAWNFLYVAGQYAAFFFVLLRCGSKQPPSADGFGTAASARGWRRFLALPAPMQIIAVFLLVSLLVSGIGIAQKVLGVAGEGIWSDPDQFPDLRVRAYSTLANPNILGGYLVLVISYCAAFFSVFQEKRLRFFLLGTGTMAALCLLYTYSRGNWLACAVMLAAFCALFCRRALVPLLVGAGLALAAGGSSVLARLGSIISGEDTSAALRIAYLESTAAIIEDFPWGVGWYGYRFVYPDYNFYLDDTSVIMYHCHNIFLNVCAELGWQGLLAFLLVWWGVFLPAAWSLARRGSEAWLRAMGRGYVLAAIGISVGGLTDYVYFNTQMGLLFWLCGGLVMLCAKAEREMKQETADIGPE